MPGRFTPVTQCRISGSPTLLPILSLGRQALTGVFPRRIDQPVTEGPLELVWCPDSGLLQLAHSYDPTEMYGGDYGYRSGLNQSMVRHLARKFASLERAAKLKASDTVLDIGSNDATGLNSYTIEGLQRIGIDPTGEKFRGFYPADTTLVPEFFTAAAYRRVAASPARL